MKNFKKIGLEPLSRAELSKIKGGTDDCPAVYSSCNPNCGHFGTSYSAFATCVTTHSTTCSPLSGWYVICPNG
ncbi:hypothetical protein [Mucilaginibacter sp.]|jgi:hypothetical protein|uniref:hypothetical protein n=1 Tax=Mucilaginibacter sp. TaxID=1882438 RepID=UPI002626F819|nr:hypothetical protein [Mucilaginibacter sp.]MDB4920386.1 hypothetical protein [Mucilaginibacter sp.]